MAQRWRVLALLFAVRMTMGFQFQSVASLAPLIRNDFGVGIADVGFLIGLYMSPGLVLAVPSGAIGRRFGDKAMILAGLVLMAAGGLIMALAGTWGWQIAGRLVAGVGGVLLNVLMSKLVTDWFSGKEIATAMAIFVNSWPAGLALALLVLPAIGTGAGVSQTFLFVTLVVVAGFAAFALLYPAPQATAAALSGVGARPKGLALVAVIAAGLVWGLYNAALSMIFSFGTTMLIERGWTLAAAASVTSLVLWIVAISVPLGGVIADRSGRPILVLVGSCIAFAATMLAAVRTEMVVPMFVALGLVSGLAAGPIMSLPSRVLLPETRAVGMGIFFTCFYLVIVLAPWTGGLAASAAGSAQATFDLGAGMLAACCVGVWVFLRVAALSAPLALAPVRS